MRELLGHRQAQGPERSGHGKAAFQASDSSVLPPVAPVHRLCSLQFRPLKNVLGTVTAIVLATLTSLLSSADPSRLLEKALSPATATCGGPCPSSSAFLPRLS